MFRFVEHTAELEVELEAPTPEGVLQEGLRAFAELAGSGAGETIERTVDVRASDRPALLAAWLDELVFLAETEGLLPEKAALDVSETHATGVVLGRQGDVRPLVKAVTLHRLRFRQENGIWKGRVVLDV